MTVESVTHKSTADMLPDGSVQPRCAGRQSTASSPVHWTLGGTSTRHANPSALDPGQDLVDGRECGRPDAAPVAAQREQRHQRRQPPHLQGSIMIPIVCNNYSYITVTQRANIMLFVLQPFRTGTCSPCALGCKSFLEQQHKLFTAGMPHHAYLLFDRPPSSVLQATGADWQARVQPCRCVLGRHAMVHTARTFIYPNDLQRGIQMMHMQPRTLAVRSCDAVTTRLSLGATATALISLSCAATAAVARSSAGADPAAAPPAKKGFTSQTCMQHNPDQ